MKKIAGMIAIFQKSKPLDAPPIALALIKRTYENAIEYTGIPRGMRGMILFTGILASAVGLGVGWKFFLDGSSWGANSFLGAIGIILAFICFIFGIYSALKSIRLELFRPEDEPIIFDRKNRRVYRIYADVQPGWRGVFRPWPLKSSSYDWDLINVEHQAAIIANTSTISRIHALVFLVQASHDDQTIIDSFTIGNGLQMSEITVPAVWEHIRRFMEDDGPRHPIGELQVPFETSITFSKFLAMTGPYGKNFTLLRKNHKIWLLLFIIFSPVLLPITTLVGISSWLSYKTAIPIEWEPNVLDAIGQPFS